MSAWRAGWRPACVAALPGIFIIGIFFGDVWLGKLLLPASMMVLPFFLWVFPPTDLIRFRNIPAGAFPLLALACVVVAQISIGMRQEVFPVKSDLAIWRPVVYAGAIILMLRHLSLTDRSFGSYLFAGGALTGLVMLATTMFLPADRYLIPQQNLNQVQWDYFVAKSKEAALAGKELSQALVNPLALEGQAMAPVPETEKAFYEGKDRVRNFLGQSNYLAVFFVFLFTVALFTRQWWWAAVFAGFVLFTLSRFGFLFLLVSVAGYVLVLFRVGIGRISVGILATVLAGMAGLFLLQDLLPDVPGATSMLLRLRYWTTGLDVASHYPILGAPRSVFLDELGYSIAWNPHNSVLWVAANFGLLGLAAYACYVAIALVEIGRAAVGSRLWTGVLLGVVIVLAWSLVENIVLTPAFEILFASLYILARNSRRRPNPVLAAG